MPLTTYDQIYKQVADEKEQLLESAYPDDLLSEWADSEVPVYNHEIISEWTDLDSDCRDQWQEIGAGSNTSIVNLMKIDIYLFYRECYTLAWIRLQEELEDTEELV
jgi:hypothetical protein